MPSPSPAAIAAAWQAYESRVWDDPEGKERAKDACMKAAIEAAAKVDGVVWPGRSETA